MKLSRLEDMDLLSIGHTIQLYGAIYSGEGKMFFVPLPDERAADLQALEHYALVMDEQEMEQFLRQTDVLDIRGPGKAILRKSQRQIDQAMAWRVFERDGYRCRYCGEKRPLTVDHLIPWEQGGPTVAGNLVAADRCCNKTRGNLPYKVWMEHPYYQRVSQVLTEGQRDANRALIYTLDAIPRVRPRSR